MSDAKTKPLDELLQVPLTRLEEAGLPRPPSLTLEQYLERLMSEEVLSPKAVRRFLAVYQDVRYGSKEVPGERVAQACEALTVEAARLDDLDEAALGRLRANVTPAPAPAPALASRPTGPLIPLSPPPAETGEAMAAPSLPGRKAAEPVRPSLRGRLPSARWLALVASSVLVWSVAMLGVGYWQSPKIKALVKRLNPDKKPQAPQRATPRQMLDHLRKVAAAKPEDLRRWRRYASYAFHIEQYPDAIIGYHHIIARKPGDHESLNNLAWLYCTAKDPAARNRKRALALAERAYALDKAPHIADTLAEACFQNGHVQRAISLEEDALQRATRRKEFFRKQLEKFKRAREQPGKKPDVSKSVP